MKTSLRALFAYLAFALLLFSGAAGASAAIAVRAEAASAGRQAAQGAAPTISSVSPSEAYNYEPATITINGSGFVATPVVSLGNEYLPVSFVDSTTLVATVPAYLAPGSYTLTVKNPDGESATRANAFRVLPGGDGSMGPWRFTTPLPPGIGPRVQVGRYFYTSTGGRAQLNADGSIGPWQQANSPPPQGFFLKVHARGYMYAFSRDTAAWATINPDGSLGPWQITSPMTMQRLGFMAVHAGDHIYAVGGANETSELRSVEFARINPDGSLGPWQATSPMILPRVGHAVVHARGYIYAISGAFSSIPDWAINEFAAINPDGSLGPWQTTSSLQPRRDHAAVHAGGYVYVIGGSSPSGPVHSGVMRAAIMDDGSLGPWQVTGQMIEERYALAAFFVEGHVYAFGGHGRMSSHSSVELAPLNPISLAGVSPAAVRPGRAITITVSGVNFRSGASVRIGEAMTLTTSFVSTTTLTAGIPDSLESGRWYSVTVTNPNGWSASLERGLAVDGNPPSGTILINGGGPYSNSPEVALSLSGTDDFSGVVAMAFSNEGSSYTPFEPYSSSRAWTLPAGDGTKRVYALFRDAAGNTSAVASDSIVLDTAAPQGSVTVAGGTPSNATLRLDAGDTLSGVAWMLISNHPNLKGVVWEPYAASRAWTFDGNNTVYVHYRDGAGNVSERYSAFGGTNSPLPFRDVPSDAYYYLPVQYLASWGMLSGYNCGEGCLEFRPFNETTRGQLAKIVVLAEGWELLNPGAPTFADVPWTNPFYREIETAAARGIISGYDLPGGGREFRWASNVTRGQLSKIVVLAEGWELPNPSTPTFVDVPQTNPFYREIEAAAAHGIISGYDVQQGREFRWSNSAIRAQVSKMVYLAVTCGDSSCPNQ